jgi:hypothetical protein
MARASAGGFADGIGNRRPMAFGDPLAHYVLDADPASAGCAEVRSPLLAVSIAKNCILNFVGELSITRL